jgi:hypothetical protein
LKDTRDKLAVKVSTGLNSDGVKCWALFLAVLKLLVLLTPL